jgi:hypothetical protein
MTLALFFLFPSLHVREGYCLLPTKDIVTDFTIRVAAAITLFAIVSYTLFEYHTGMKYYQPPTAELVTLE